MRSPRDRAAQTARPHQQQVAVQSLNEEMIEANFAEFVDDDQSTGERRIAQQGVQETGFAGPKKTGDDGQRERRGRPFLPRGHRRRHGAQAVIKSSSPGVLLRRLALRLAGMRRDFRREMRLISELCRDFRMFVDAALAKLAFLLGALPCAFLLPYVMLF